MAHCTQNCVMNIINLGNSIIGVSILAMPYCFRKCGILLSLLLITMSGVLVRSACYLLLKAAIMARRRNFEFLAFHTFGSTGKLAVEIGIIGFLIGVCIAFFVVIGDLGPPLVAECLLVENTPNLRAEVLVCVGFFVALPLGLLRKVDSLTSCSALSIAFYGFLVLKIISEALPKMMINEWWYEVNWWQPSGLLPCLPIFSMALSCQTQLFEFFDTLSDPSLKRMTTVVSGAVHLCSAVYVLVGIFGYIAFHDKVITGNILMRLTPSLMTEFIKLGFIITVAISFPLCLFPCRTSLHSLLFKQGVSHHDMGVNFIPDRHFRALTISLVSITIGIAIMLPNIEFVLGIIGSTIGTMVCLILPAIIFIHGTTKNSSEKLRAQCVMLVGIFILVACTYSTLRENKEPHIQLPENVHVENHITEKPFTAASLAPLQKDADKGNAGKQEIVINELQKAKIKETIDKDNKSRKDIDQKRQEPPVPQEPEVVKAEPNVDLDPQALQKEDKELQKDVQKSSVSSSALTSSKVGLDKQEQLLRELEAHHKEQKKLLEEQKKLLEELKQHKESHDEINKAKVLPPEDIRENPIQKVKLPVKNQESIKVSENAVVDKVSEFKQVQSNIKPNEVNPNPRVISDKKVSKDLHNVAQESNIVDKQHDIPILNANVSYKNAENLNFENKGVKKIEQHVISVKKIEQDVNSKLLPETKNLKHKIEEPQIVVHNETQKKVESVVGKEKILLEPQKDKESINLEKNLLNDVKKEPLQAIVEKRETKVLDSGSDIYVVKRDVITEAFNQDSALVTDKPKVSPDSGKREMRKLLYINSTNTVLTKSN